MKNKSDCLIFVAYNLLFCWATKFEYTYYYLTVQMSIWIYSWREKSLEQIFKYILALNFFLWLFRQINLFFNIYYIFLDILIFAIHLFVYNCPLKSIFVCSVINFQTPLPPFVSQCQPLPPFLVNAQQKWGLMCCIKN